MAVSKMAQSGSLAIKYQTGTNATGNPTYSTRNYSGVDSTATDQDMFDVAQAIAGVTKYTLVDILRIDKNALVNM